MSDRGVEVLAIAAHRDDVELTCGGTLVRCVEQGYRTGVIDLTEGENLHVVPVSEVAAAATVSNALQYVSDFPAVFVHRLKGLKPQRTAADFTATGASVGAARDADPVVNLP